ncbi:hypothetical protein Syun_021737 [Stephania yunnanensis]|uniref:RNase H type-1 domain-containing protein n=1 Tax=Stephania yunnanensis TaxID=152371 RepID=A0AAP0NRC9_9MAGN
MGVGLAILELNNKSVVDLLKANNIPRNHHWHLVSLIHQLLDRGWDIHIFHTHCKENRAAD